MKSKIHWRSLWSLILICLILNSEGIRMVNTIQIGKNFNKLQTLKPYKKEKPFSKIRLNTIARSKTDSSAQSNYTASANDESSLLHTNSLDKKNRRSTNLNRENINIASSDEHHESSVPGYDNDKEFQLATHSSHHKKSEKTGSSDYALSETNPYAKHLRRLMQTKNKLFFTLIAVSSLILTIVNKVLEYVEEEFKKATNRVRNNDLKGFEKVQMAWRQMQESHCMFFKFLRFHLKTNSIFINVNSKLLLARIESSCKNNDCPDKNLREKVRLAIEKIDSVQDSLEDFLSSKVTNACSLNGEQFMDAFQQASESKSRELMKLLEINVENNVQESDGLISEVGGSMKIEGSENDNDDEEKGVMGFISELGDSIKSVGDGKKLDQKSSVLNANEKKGIGEALNNDAKAGNGKSKRKLLTKGLDLVHRGSKVHNSISSAVNSWNEVKENGTSFFGILKAVISTASAATTFILQCVGYFTKYDDVADAAQDLSDNVTELLIDIIDFIEASVKVDKSEDEERKLRQTLYKTILPQSAKVALYFAKLTLLLIGAAARAFIEKFMLVLDFVKNLITFVENFAKVWNAWNEYNQAKEDSLNNAAMREHFTQIIKNNLNYEKCSTLAEVSFAQRFIDDQRFILKQFVQTDRGLSSSSTPDETTKGIMSTFIDQICYQDVYLCLHVFNEGFLSTFKNVEEMKKFKEDVYYRSTRSAISSVSIAKSESDELLLLTMGYKQYAYFKDSNYRDCGWPGISEQECRNLECQWKMPNGNYPTCFHQQLFSLMICRGCNERFALSEITIKSIPKEGSLASTIREIEQKQNNDKDFINRAYSLGIYGNVHWYIIFTERKLEASKLYVTDFVLNYVQSNSIPYMLMTPPAVSDFKGIENYYFGNKEKALAGGLYPWILKQTSRADSLCEIAEGQIVFLSRKEDEILYLSKDNANCSSQIPVSKHKITNSNNYNDMTQIYDFVLPGSVRASKLETLNFSNQNIVYKKNLYQAGGQSFNVNVGQNNFERVFTKGNPLYEIVERDLCHINRADKCFFQGDSMEDLVDNDFAKKYGTHDLRNINDFKPESHKQYFIELERAILRGGPLSLDEFNSYGLRHHQIGQDNPGTVYKFFNKLSRGQTSVSRSDFWYDKFKILTPIKFSKNCPSGEQSLYFDDELGPQEHCINDRRSNNREVWAWLPIESNYYIYFHQAQHSKDAGQLTHFTDGWIPHPDMSRGFNYWDNSRMKRISKTNIQTKGHYEFTFEVYVRPYFGSGYVPVGRKFTDESKCTKVYGLDHWAVSLMIGFSWIAKFTGVCAEKLCFESFFPTPRINNRSEKDVDNKEVEDYGTPLNREYVDKNNIYNVYFGVHNSQRFLHYSLYIFFNNPTYKRRMNAQNIAFKPRTMAEWSKIYARGNCKSLFSTERCDDNNMKMAALRDICEKTGDSYFFPASLSEGNQYLEFKQKDNANEIILEENPISSKTHKIDKVFYFEMKPLNNVNSEFNINYREHDAEMLKKYGYRPFLVPDKLRQESFKDKIKDGYLIKTWGDSALIALRIWVRDNYRVNFRRKDVCDTQRIRRIVKGEKIPFGWRLMTLEEGKKYESQFKPTLPAWSIVAFANGQYHYGNTGNDYTFVKQVTSGCGEQFIIQW